jgi:hypothetical protein
MIILSQTAAKLRKTQANLAGEIIPKLLKGVTMVTRPKRGR